MLSKKQIWRRTSPSKRKQLNLDLLFEHSRSYLKSNRPVALTHRDSVAITLRKSRDDTSSTADLHKKARSVRFSQYVEVCLIPTRSELFHFSQELYWTLSDCTAFKLEATEEIRSFCKSNTVSVREAIFHLYQPGAENLPLASLISNIEEQESLSSCVLSDETSPPHVDVALHVVPHRSELEQPINNNNEEVVVKFNKTDVELSMKEPESADSNETSRLRNSPRDKVIWERKWSRDKAKHRDMNVIQCCQLKLSVHEVQSHVITCNYPTQQFQLREHFVSSCFKNLKCSHIDTSVTAGQTCTLNHRATYLRISRCLLYALEELTDPREHAVITSPLVHSDLEAIYFSK